MDLIGRYEKHGELGRGGFGTVFRAYDPVMRRDVAIKLLTSISDPELLARFRSEAATTGTLKHKNIITVYDYGDHHGQPYLVMEFLEGRTLKSFIEQGPALELAEKVSIMRQVAEGLGCAHDSGIIHRDIKPANIMILSDGTAKVLDFGIARLLDDSRTRHTAPGMLIGTLEYMAPDQIQSGEAGIAADIYSFGVTAYELVSGKQPFRCDQVGTILHRVMHFDPPPLRQLVPACPEALEVIVGSAMEKDPAGRYKNLHDLLLDLAPLDLALRRERAGRYVETAAGLLAAGELEAAQKQVRAALDLDPENQAANETRKRIQREHEARASLERRLAELIAAAAAFEQAARHDEALRTLEAALIEASADWAHEVRTEIQRRIATVRDARAAADRCKEAELKSMEAERLRDEQLRARNEEPAKDEKGSPAFRLLDATTTISWRTLRKFGLAIALVTVLTWTTALLISWYSDLARRVDSRLAAGLYGAASMMYASPQMLGIGEDVTLQEIVAGLRRAGYSEDRNNRTGHFTNTGKSLEIYPGPDSYFQRADAVIKFAAGRVTQIISLPDNSDRSSYQLEPEPLLNIPGKNHETGRSVRYRDLPLATVHAVMAAENMHSLSAWSVKAASLLFPESNESTWRRNIRRAFVAFHLRRKLRDEDIFALYANLVPLGNRDSIGVRGFGAAAQVYFARNIEELTLPQAATLAGMAQDPPALDPFRWPAQAKERRNVVLKTMEEFGFVTAEEYAMAVASPLTVRGQNSGQPDAPYFADLAQDMFEARFADSQSGSYRIYTTLDLRLQSDASEAVRFGMREVDQLLLKENGGTAAYPECALIALDPVTGKVKALVGGRNYGTSRLNHVLARRQPGVAFMPFAYAAALNTPLSGSPSILTASTGAYSRGSPTMHDAFIKSSSDEALKFAELTGPSAVVDLARRAGLNMHLEATPAVALGQFEVTPLEIAAGYTMFANEGARTKPELLDAIRDRQGREIFRNQTEHNNILDPRVAFLMVSFLRDLAATGAGRGVRARGIDFPVAVETGGSHDGWMAGFSPRLICVVWVGFDDNRELKLDGSRTALPIWAEFMRRAHQHREYRDAGDFVAPSGIAIAKVDVNTGQLATPRCPKVRTEYFIAGTEPAVCSLHGGGATGPVPRGAAGSAPIAAGSHRVHPEKKGTLGRIREIFKD